ncbi:glycosyltransferase family 87 protein [Sphingomonas crocodyli]|uniref:DUF2029 domain-containing protein n=1 Tax=Sphingomonas crocodyli TaxID=1979270 RepID=A0A437MA68_9SPHN|nr:glycosyltransferase family 87 protein [Sphingomonas crocodyli]RVT94547.1 DUF2029 domain-containing protein [Sphingomonas crocodyli]
MSDARGPDAAPTGAVAVLWFAGTVSTLLLFAFDIGHLRGLLVPEHGVLIGRDFVNIWVGGKLAWGGRLDILYDPQAYWAAARGMFAGLLPHNYSYPPQSLIPAALLSLLPYPAALATWLVATTGLFLIAARPFMRGLPLWMAALTPGALINIWAGQYGLLAGALWLFAFAAMDRRQGQAGLSAALLTVKPHLGLLIPIIWIARRRWTALGVAVAGTLAIVAVSAALFGTGIWIDYLTKAPETQRAILEAPGDQLYFRMMPTTLVALRGYPAMLGIAVQAATALAALALLWRARKAGAGDLAFIAATATFLILPYAFDYDMTVATLGFGLTLATRWRRLAAWEAPVLCVAYLLPGRMIAFGAIPVGVAPLVLLGALWVQVRHASPQESAV